MLPLIKTDRLILRTVKADDINIIQPIIHDPRIYENVARISPNQSRAKTADWISGH